MTVEEIISEIEKMDGNVEKNTEIKFVYGLIARGVWQIALQIAEANASKNAAMEDAMAHARVRAKKAKREMIAAGVIAEACEKVR